MAIRQGYRGYRRCDSSPLPSSRIVRYKLTRNRLSRSERRLKRISRRRSFDEAARRKIYDQERYHTDTEVALDIHSVADSVDNNRQPGSLNTGTISCPSPISFDVQDSDSDEENYDDVKLGSKRLAFLFATLAPSADLVNIWRFPYIVYRHGGIVLAPFVALYLILGLPLYYLELILGQAVLKKKCCGEKAMGKIIPILKGMTITSTILLAIICVYYMNVISWALVYLFVSLQESLPWSPCTDGSSPFGCLSANISESPRKCPQDDPLCNSTLSQHTWQDYLSLDAITSSNNGNEHENYTSIDPHKSTQLLHFLEFESISAKQVLAILTAWIFVYMNVMKGKVYFKKTAVLPSLLLLMFLFILLGKATGQHGFQSGLKLYFDFRVAPLSKPELWSDVITQVVLSLGIGTGVVHRIGQRSPPACSLLQDAMAVTVTNIGVAFIGGIVTFACLGSLAASIKADSMDFLPTDIEASFVGLPAVLATLPGAVVWTALFFSILTLLSLRRQKLFVFALAAMMPNSFFSSRKRTRLSMLVICGALFSCGIIFTTKAGVYLLTIIDVYVIGYVSILLCLLECTFIVWMYGTKRFFKAFEDFQRTPVHLSWKIIWLAVVPFLMLVLLAFMLLSHEMPFDGDRVYDKQTRVIGWLLLAITVLPIPAYALFCTIKALCNGNDRLQSLKRICHPCFTDDCSLVRTRKCNFHSNSPATSPMLVIRMADDALGDSSLPSIPYGFVIRPQKKSSRLSKFSTSSLLAWGKSSPSMAPNSFGTSTEDASESPRPVPAVFWEDTDGNKHTLHPMWKRSYPALTRSKSMPLSHSAQDINEESSGLNVHEDSISVVENSEDKTDVSDDSSAASIIETKENPNRSGELRKHNGRSKSFDNPAYETEVRSPT